MGIRTDDNPWHGRVDVSDDTSERCSEWFVTRGAGRWDNEKEDDDEEDESSD